MSRFEATREQLAASDPAQSVWVTANAGSGKTHVLIDRVVRLLLHGAAPQSILCLTFTKAAAAEMASRLFAKLSHWAGLDDRALEEALAAIGERKPDSARLKRARQLFARAIETPGGLKIQTIHAFCEKLLHLFPVEAGLAPGFKVMGESERSSILKSCYREVLQELSAKNAESALSLMDEGAIADGEAFELLASSFLPGNAIYHWLVQPGTQEVDIEPVLRNLLSVPADAALDASERFVASIDRGKLEAVTRAFAGVEPHRKHDAGSYLRAALRAGDARGTATALKDLFLTKGKTARGRRQDLFSKKTQSHLASECEWLMTLQSGFCQALEHESLLHKINATVSLVGLMRELVLRFEQVKRERGLYDFDDLINKARALFSDSRAARWVLYKLDSGLSHILVDEAQDTSPRQWQIIEALAGEFYAGEGREQSLHRTVFVVGDIKQSIFSFQGADTGVFRAARDLFRGKAENAGLAFPAIDLTVSYRSTREILQIADAVFAKNAPATAGIDSGEGALHQAQRRGESGHFEIWPVMEPEEQPEPEAWHVPVDHVSHDNHRKRLARFIASRIKTWIGKRMLVSRGRPVVPGDILLLFQRRGPLFEAVIAALRAAGVPVAGADRLKLKQNLAVQDVMALAQFCLLPCDDYALACVLKSPFVPFPLTEEQLLGLAAGRMQARLWDRLAADPSQQENTDWLNACKAMALARGPYRFVAHVLQRFRKPMLERLGPEALDATDVLIDLSRQYEQEHPPSLSAFIHWFLGQEAEHKRELGEPGGEVRLMTVHGAKGLEAEIVILPDAADPPSSSRGRVLRLETPNGAVLPLFNATSELDCEVLDSWKAAEVTRQRNENKRLLYVALTRARDELYVCGSAGLTSTGNRRSLNADSWYGLIEIALNQNDTLAFQRVDIGHPNGAARRLGPADVTAIQTGAAEGPKRELPPWINAPLPPPDAAAPWSRTISHLSSSRDSPHSSSAVQRGVAIHRFLELHRPDDEAQALRLGVRLGLPEEVTGELARLVASERLKAFFGSGSQAEVSIHGRLEGLGAVEGQVDRLRITSDCIWLLDFKSGSLRSSETRTAYLGQMAGYAAVLREAYPHHSLKAALLWTQTATLEWLEEDELSRALDRLRTGLAQPAA